MMTSRFSKKSLTATIVASSLAVLLAAPAHAEVSWMDVLADPDNQTLNQQFITERLAIGDLPAALSAVERLINQQPADVGLRLIRAEILVNLGNDTLASGELEALAKLPLVADQKAKIANMQSVIDGRAKRWRTTVSASVGMKGSDNANSYPSSGLLEFKLSPIAAASTSTYESFGGAQKSIREVATMAAVTVASSYELANQDRDRITIGASHQEFRGRKYEYLTNGTSAVFAGSTLKLGSLRLSSNVNLSETQAKTSANSNVIRGGLTAGHALPLGMQSYLSATYGVINKLSSSAFTTADQNDGHSRGYKLGLSRTFKSRYALFAEASRNNFNPTESRRTPGTNAYNALMANANNTNGMMIGFAVSPTQTSRFTASLSSSEAKYPNMDPTSRKFRRDTQTKSSIGLQLSGAAFSDKLDGMMIGVNASTTKNDSNIRQFDYKRSDVALSLSYQLAE